MNFYHDKNHDLLIYDRPSPLVLQHVPEAKQVNGQFVAVPRTLRNLQVLRWLNYNVPPIMSGYDWPIEPGRKPYQSQKLAANFHVLHPRCFNLSDMGVGKTCTMLWAADWLMLQHKPGTFRVLIVAPLSILERVWANAIFSNFLGRRSYEILHGTSDARLKALDRPADFYIINYDGVGIGAHTRKKLELDGFSQALADRDDIRLVICDEASAYRDAQTKRHRLARLVIGRKEYLWLATGTPTPNAPTDAYGLAKLVNNAFGKSFTSFRQETMTQIRPNAFKWVAKREGYDAARRLLTPSIRIDIRQVWDGPEMTTQQRQVALTAEQKKHFADLKRSLQIILKSGQPIPAANEAAARTKFIQVSLGAIYDDNHRSHNVDASSRIEELRAVIAEAPSKLIIFVPLTNIINLLYRELREYTREIVNGDVGQRERSRIFQAFQQQPDPRLLLVDPGTVAHGLDLFAAQTVVWYGPTDKTELYLQGNKRAHRPGQKFPVTVVQLVSNNLEREIFRRLETNTQLMGALLDAIRRGDL